MIELATLINGLSKVLAVGVLVAMVIAQVGALALLFWAGAGLLREVRRKP